MAKEIIAQNEQAGKPKGVNMYGIEETIEVLRGVKIVTDAIEEALADDGKISSQEGLKIALSLIVEPRLFEAVQGIQSVPKELFSGDLTEVESTRLRSEGLTQFTDNPDIQAAIFGLSIFINSSIRFVQARKDNQALPTLSEVQNNKI